ncbi:MAG TPA: murein biosynthesis integral membrane protein MurJ [Chitinispirillaceae bacterium]|nr:murein biosynthesis integral membrane protein MurJ [Chitinispirillaceae bacterium]
MPEKTSKITESVTTTAPKRPVSHSLLVASGIFLSRILGFVRQRVFGHFLGISDAADMFNTAFRIPNFLQNLFGEGALSASFIPVYAKLRAEGRIKDAENVAHAVLSILSVVVSLLVLIGIIVSPALVSIIAPGFEGEKRLQTILLVKILFPGAGLLVLSAWCLGILNSHRRFFLPYAAPVIWNIAIIVSLVVWGGTSTSTKLVEITAWGSVAGSFLQFTIQLPSVIRLLGSIRFSTAWKGQNIRKVVTNFFPAFISRGVIQISAFIDSAIASILGSGSVAIVATAQMLYTLPVSLFGMSVSASELPEMSSATGTREEIAKKLQLRINAGLARISFFVVPSAVAFFALGDVVAAALFQTGEFDSQGVHFVWATLCGSSFGLLASTYARLYSSAFYALQDTKTPFKFACIRVTTGATLSYLFATNAPHLLGIDTQWGTAFMTLSSGIAGWIEYSLLRKSLNKIIGDSGPGLKPVLMLYSAAIVAALFGWGVKLLIAYFKPVHPIVSGAVILGTYVSAYFLASSFFGISEAKNIVKKVLRRK